jgi:NAD(P)H-hydrate epimerase
MDVVTAAEMRAIDRCTIETYHVPGIVLMENAGLCLLQCLYEAFPDLPGRQVTIVAGRGNNGGDGSILARHLWHRGVDVHLVLLTAASALRGDARQAYAMARAYGVPLERCTTLSAWQRVARRLQQTDIIVDALLGTGLHQAVEGLYAEVIRTLNALQKPIVAVDIPSGLAADDGQICGAHIQATHTVTFALPKRSLLLYPAAAAAGALHVVDIGIPRAAVAAAGIQVALLTEDAIRTLLPERHPNAHKGSQGHVLVVAGSTGKSGAGALASRAALRAGAGLVTFALPARLNSAMEASVTEVMTLPVAETPTGAIATAAVSDIMPLLARASALVLGPGLGMHPDTVTCVHDLLRHSTVPVVLDADGLNSLVGHLEVLESCQVPVILTPHPGEMARLLGCDTAAVQAQRLDIAQAFVQRFQVYVVLKGAHTVIYAPDGRRWINPTGNPAMATAGTGDVLAGVIAALLSQGLSPLHAVQGGVYLHGKAGDLVLERLGASGLIASDLIEALPSTLSRIKRGVSCTPS